MSRPRAKAPTSDDDRAQRFAFPALLIGSTALAFGPWLVRLADVGPVATGFWRLSLALPFLLLIGRAIGQPLVWPRKALVWAVFVAAAFYAADLGAWNVGIRMTKLANATLFGNISSFVFAGWGLWLARRAPSRRQGFALLLAALGAAALMGSSYDLSPRYFRGDVLALFAGLLYAGYLIGIERLRSDMAPIPLLILSTAFGAAMLLPASAVLGERILPTDWTPVLMFALSSQVLGQGLLVYAIGKLSPLVVGLTLLTQPAISALVGWIAYRETLTPLDFAGAAAIAAALVLVRLPERGLRAPPLPPS